MTDDTANAFVFDAYGTLFDVHAAIARHRVAAGPDAERFSELWRLKQLEYSWTLTLSGQYVDFWTLTQRALDYAFARVPSVDRALRPQLLEAYQKLDAYPNARTTVAALKARGLATAILSNGAPPMLDVAVSASGMASLLDAVLSVDAVRMYKPRPEVYALVTARFALRPREVVVRVVQPLGCDGRGGVRLSPAMGQSHAPARRVRRTPTAADRDRSVGRRVDRSLSLSVYRDRHRRGRLRYHDRRQ